MATKFGTKHPSVEDMAKTTFSSAGTAADTALVVKNGTAFSADQMVLMNGYGNPTSDIRLISSADPTATGIVLDASYALQFGYNIGTTIQICTYNQVNISYSTDLATLFATGTYATPADAAAAAAWTNLATIDITPGQLETIYNDTSSESRSYRTRYYDSENGVYSTYSDPILPTGFEEYSVGGIIQKAFNATGKKSSEEDGGQYPVDFMLEQINIAASDVHSRRKRWSFNQDFNYVVSEITAGKQDYLLPTTIAIDYTNRATFNARIEDAEDLIYLDKHEMNRMQENVHNSTLTAELNTSSTTLTLSDSSNFADSGNITVITGATKDNVAYTANNRTTNVLTLDTTTGVTTTHASGQNAWQSESIGTPRYYSIWEDYIYLYPVPETDFYQRNLTMDFYKKFVEVDSYQDYILFPSPNIIFYWLCHIIYEKAGDQDLADRYESRYEKAITTLIKLETTGQRSYIAPKLTRVQGNRWLMPVAKYDSE